MNIIKEAWHSPLNVLYHIQKLVKEVGLDVVLGHGKYKKVREARIAMFAALIMYEGPNGNPVYIRLPEQDPPDAVLRQEDKDVVGQSNLINVEITTYSQGRNGESFLEQLKRTKAPQYHKYSEEFIVLYHVDDSEVDFETANEYLKENKTPFPIWIFREIQSYPETIAEITFLNPTVRRFTLDVGKTASDFKDAKHPDIIFPKRIAKIKGPKLTKAEEYPYPPWGVID